MDFASNVWRNCLQRHPAVMATIVADDNSTMAVVGWECF
jgi:hypothetical protein